MKRISLGSSFINHLEEATNFLGKYTSY